MFLHSEMRFGDHSEVHGQRSIKAEVMVLSSAAQKEKQGSQCPAFEAEAPHDCNIQLKMAPDFLITAHTDQSGSCKSTQRVGLMELLIFAIRVWLTNTYMWGLSADWLCESPETKN